MYFYVVISFSPIVQIVQLLFGTHYHLLKLFSGGNLSRRTVQGVLVWLWKISHMYTCILPYIHTYIHTYIQCFITYIHIYACIHTYIHTYIQTYIAIPNNDKYIHAYMYLDLKYITVHKYIHTYIHTYILSCSLDQGHTYIHTYMHTNT